MLTPDQRTMTNKDGAVSDTNHSASTTTNTNVVKADLRPLSPVDAAHDDPANGTNPAADGYPDIRLAGCRLPESTNDSDIVFKNGSCDVGLVALEAGNLDKGLESVHPVINGTMHVEANDFEKTSSEVALLTPTKMSPIREGDDEASATATPLATPPSPPICRCAQQTALIDQLRSCLLAAEAKSQRLLRAKDDQLEKITQGLLVLEQRVRRQTEHLTRMLAERDQQVADQERDMASLLRLNRKMAARLHRQEEAREEDARRAEKRRRKSRRISWHNEVFVHNGSQLTKTTIKDENNRRVSQATPVPSYRTPASAFRGGAAIVRSSPTIVRSGATSIRGGGAALRSGTTAVQRGTTVFQSGATVESVIGGLRWTRRVVTHDDEVTEEEDEDIEEAEEQEQVASSVNGSYESEDEVDDSTTDSLDVDQACDAVDQALEESDTDSATDEAMPTEGRPLKRSVTLLRHQHSVPSCDGGGGRVHSGDDSGATIGGATGCPVVAQGDPPNLGVVYNRVMSNHRSVTKPKDVKYKKISRVKSRSLEELRGRLKRHLLPGTVLDGGRPVLLEQGEEIV